jgi:biotin operon repressor
MGEIRNKMSKEFMVTEIAEFLGISRATIYAMLSDGRLRGLDLHSIYKYAYEEGRRSLGKEIISQLKNL